MPTTVEIAVSARKQLKKLKRKFPAVSSELNKLVAQLEADDRPGDKIPNVGYDVYKVRLANPSAQRGKSGGFRVIYYVQLADSVILISIYSKSDQSDISPEQIQYLLEDL
jgi:mRNA-degrading endonuclease RelE of RelBE toxin-antitoxin system